MEALTPRQIVAELDRYIIGQENAKRMVAVAIRNRWRRQQLDPALRDEIAPKNIILMGPTGVGKTEIARRLAKLTGAPFIKVEATKYTEVGYVGRDVESMVRDLMDVGEKLVRDEEGERVAAKAAEQAEARLITCCCPEAEVMPVGRARARSCACCGGTAISMTMRSSLRSRSRRRRWTCSAGPAWTATWAAACRECSAASCRRRSTGSA